MSTLDRPMSVEEVAKHLGLHPETVYKMIRRGQMPSTPIGRRVLVTESQLRQFIEDHKIDAKVS